MAHQPSASSPRDQSIRAPVFAKLVTPTLRGDAVGRNRLMDMLERARPAKLVLIQAPAGYGKSTLMVQWSKHLKDAGEGAGWITLDEAANDAAHLLASLEACLLPDTPRGTLDLLAVINRCASDNARYTLFLDEVEVLQEPQALQFLELLLDYSPENLHIVMGTRSAPPLPLARLRVRHEIAEFNSQDLRFMRDEAAQFLYVRSGTRMRKSVLDELLDKTEGWAAALQLISLSLARGADGDGVMRHLSGSRQQVVEYLTVDVVGKLHDSVRGFLLETSVLRRLSAPLCDAVTGQSDSATMLLKLELGNLFLQPLDNEREWFRYHALFSDFLRAQLREKFPGRELELARKAADWCAANGLMGEAVEYSLQARDTAGAITNMELCIDHQVHIGQFRTIRHWLAALPAGEIDLHPRLIIANAWSLAFCQDYTLARESIEQLQRLSQDPHTAPVYRNSLLALEPTLLARIGEYEKAIARGKVAWAEIGRDAMRERGNLANQIAFFCICTGEHEEAQRYLREAMACHAATRPASVLGLALTAGHSAIAEACLGNLSVAIHLYQSLDKIVADHMGEVSPHMEPGFLPAISIGLIAELLYERGEIDETEAILDRYSRFLESIPSVESITLAYLIRTRIHLSRGETTEAEEVLSTGSLHAARIGIPRLLAALDWERVRIALIAGDVGHASVLARTAGWPANPDFSPALVLPSEEVNGAGIGLIRLYLHDGRTEQALAGLDVQIDHATRTLRRRRLVKLHILHALALQAAQRTAEALEAIGTAVRLGATMGAVRTFLDEGAAVHPLLQALADSGALRSDKKPAAYLHALIEDFAPADAAPTPSLASDTKLMVEGLSAREVQILQRLSQGYSNLAVAQQLFVSTNTVKWHLRQVYEKLGAKNRSQAIFLARKNGLLA